MNNVRSVCLVSDGIVVDFVNGTKCYYPASFLLDQKDVEGNQVLLSYDPSHTLSAPLPATPKVVLPC